MAAHDPTSLRTAFRQEYGYSPRAARSGAGNVFDVTDGDEEKITLYRCWLQKLR